MHYIHKLTALAVICFGIVAPLTSAEEAGWRTGAYDSDVTLAARPDFQYQGNFVIGDTADGPDVMLSCSERFGLSATIMLEDMTLEEIFTKAKRRLKGRAVSISVGDGKPKRANWAYDRKSKSLQSIAQWQAARVYNAAVSGKPLKLDIARHGEYELSLPAMDSTFKHFVANCPAL